MARSYPREVAQGRRPPWGGTDRLKFWCQVSQNGGGKGMYKLMGREVGGG